MKRFFRRVQPGLIGVFIYLLIRLVTDSHSREIVWMKRGWQINAIELISSFLIGYVIFFLIKRVQNKYDLLFRENLKVSLLFKEAGELFVYSIVGLNLTATVMAATTDNGLQLADLVVINLIPTMVILILHAFYRSRYYLNAYTHNLTLLEKIKNDKLSTELEFLKGQYHPHFLFNALNTVYFQMDESKAKAKETIEKLSELLRYQLYEDQQEKISVSKELEFVNRYMALQKERLPETVSIYINWEQPKGEIYPMILMPLVENACKYVGGRKKEIKIAAHSENETFVFEVVNSLEAPASSFKENGIGLSHLKRRLNLLYKDNHLLDTYAEEGFFIGKLSVPI